MPGRLITMAIAGIYYNFQATIPRQNCLPHELPAYGYSREVCDLTMDWDYSWSGGRWPAQSGFLSDPAFPCSGLFDWEMGNGCLPWSNWRVAGRGCQSSKSIRGVCRDSVGAPISGAIIQGFRTSDDAYIGETVSGADGRYDLACPNSPTDQHYLVAYYASGNLGGTTINTLVPTWRDGTS